ncbi:MAG: sulfite oxidase-like oxidoreductase [Chloroflexota bacterium]|nr:sulfite oxidase-like oxidoreductase [Chloroflexota bacterium]
MLRSRGVKRPAVAPAQGNRLPPGQHPTRRWPVFHHGEVPPFDPGTWDLRVFGLVEEPLCLSWEAFQALPRIAVTADMHCVTRWSTLDNAWEGVAGGEILARAKPLPEARFVLLHAEAGYTANLPLDAFAGEGTLLATANNGVALSPEHGAPVRAIVPSRYAWKSAKWLRGIELLAEDRPGFWEGYGYHDNADPWREERFAE